MTKPARGSKAPDFVTRAAGRDTVCVVASARTGVNSSLIPSLHLYTESDVGDVEVYGDDGAQHHQAVDGVFHEGEASAPAGPGPSAAAVDQGYARVKPDRDCHLACGGEGKGDRDHACQDRIISQSSKAFREAGRGGSLLLFETPKEHRAG